jgi:tetratricopeptide (TPR) repeat protein
MLLDAKAKLESGHMSVQPELEVTLWRRLASTSFSLGLPRESNEFTARATQLAEQNLPADHVELGYCRLLQGLVAENRGDMARAESLYRESSLIFGARLGEESAEYALAVNNVGCALKDLHRSDESRACHEKALAIRIKLFGQSHRDVAMSLRNLGTLSRALDQWDAAADYYRQALAALPAGTPAADKILMSIRANLCKLARERGNFEEAERMAREDIITLEKFYGEDSAPPMVTRQLLGLILAQEKRWDEALAEDRRALELAMRHMPADHPTIARSQWYLASHLFDAGRFEEAEPALRATARAYTACDPPSPTYVRRSLRRLASTLDRLNRPVDAREVREQIKALQPDTQDP